MVTQFLRNGCYCSFSPQINMMLANLYRKAGQERSAVTSYKEVLRQCPLALDAIIGMHDHSDASIQQTFNLWRHLYLLKSICCPVCVHMLSRVLLGLKRTARSNIPF